MAALVSNIYHRRRCEEVGCLAQVRRRSCGARLANPSGLTYSSTLHQTTISVTPDPQLRSTFSTGYFQKAIVAQTQGLDLAADVIEQPFKNGFYTAM